MNWLKRKNIRFQQVKIPLAEILTTGRAQEGMNAKILWEIRFPRTLAAAILGGALALTGVNELRL